jgi:hypothetical protein
LKSETFSSDFKNALAYYNPGVVVDNLEAVGSGADPMYDLRVISQLQLQRWRCSRLDIFRYIDSEKSVFFIFSKHLAICSDIHFYNVGVAQLMIVGLTPYNRNQIGKNHILVEVNKRKT